MELLQSCTNPWKCYKIMSSMKMTCWLRLITSITFLVCMCVNLFVSVYELTSDPPHNRAELHTTEHCAAHNRASCRENGGTWTRRFGTKTSGVRAFKFKCVTGTIVAKALFSVAVFWGGHRWPLTEKDIHICIYIYIDEKLTWITAWKIEKKRSMYRVLHWTSSGYISPKSFLGFYAVYSFETV